MAWTQADIDAIEEDLVTPELSVRFADGRELTKASVSDRLQLLQFIKASIAGSKTGGIRCRATSFTKE